MAKQLVPTFLQSRHLKWVLPCRILTTTKPDQLSRDASAPEQVKHVDSALEGIKKSGEA